MGVFLRDLRSVVSVTMTSRWGVGEHPSAGYNPPDLSIPISPYHHITIPLFHYPTIPTAMPPSLRVPSPVVMSRPCTRNHTISPVYQPAGIPYHICLQSPTTSTGGTIVTVSGISCKRTFELCPACPASAVFEKLSAVVTYDQRECWISASVVDIASVGVGGRYLGWRYRTCVQPVRRRRRWWWGRAAVEVEVDVEKASMDPAAELVELAALLPMMAVEMRNVELRLCRGSREVVRLNSPGCARMCGRLTA